MKFFVIFSVLIAGACNRLAALPLASPTLQLGGGGLAGIAGIANPDILSNLGMFQLIGSTDFLENVQFTYYHNHN